MDARKARLYLWSTWMTFHQRSVRGAVELMDSAYDVAAPDGNPEAGAAELRHAIAEQPKRSANYCLEVLLSRETPVGDRAFRLLQAAITGRPVAPVEPTRVHLFERLKEMESLPIAAAYARLVVLAPALGPIAADIEPYPVGELAGLRWEGRQRKRLDPWVGTWSKNPDALIRTAAMRRLALDYLCVAAGHPNLDPATTSHREVRQHDREKREEAGYTFEELPGGRVQVRSPPIFVGLRGSSVRSRPDDGPGPDRSARTFDPGGDSDPRDGS